MVMGYYMDNWLNLGLQKEQQVLLSAELSLQPDLGLFVLFLPLKC